MLFYLLYGVVSNSVKVIKNKLNKLHPYCTFMAEKPKCIKYNELLLKCGYCLRVRSIEGNSAASSNTAKRSTQKIEKLRSYWLKANLASLN